MFGKESSSTSGDTVEAQRPRCEDWLVDRKPKLMPEL
jgi:hypothetical protein